MVTATTHGCEDIIEGDCMPGYDDDSVFNKVLQSDMGKTMVRKYAPTLDPQSVWKAFETQISTSSKGLNERCRLHAYVSTTVYDRLWKGTTEQFVLHFHAAR